MTKTKENDCQKRILLNPINEVMQQQAKNFYIVRDEINGDTYHWIDKDISLYSSRKLWELIRSVESTPADDNDYLIDLIKSELVVRGHNVKNNPWRRPH